MRIKHYTTVESIYYLSFIGTINNVKRDGYGEAFTYINGWDNQYWGKGILEYLSESGVLTIWIGKYKENNHTDDGSFYNENGEFWTPTINGTLISNDDGTMSIDDSKVAELQEEWPLPNTIMYSKSA